MFLSRMVWRKFQEFCKKTVPQGHAPTENLERYADVETKKENGFPYMNISMGPNLVLGLALDSIVPYPIVPLDTIEFP